MKLYKAKGQGIFVNNPLNVIQMNQLIDDALLVKYKDGEEVIVDEYNIIADPKAKMEKVSEIISVLPKANDRMKSVNSINDIQIGDIIEMDGDIIIVDNDVLNGIKNSSIGDVVDIFGDGSCIFYTPLKENGEELTGNYEFKLKPTVHFNGDYAEVTSESNGDSNALCYKNILMKDKRSISFQFNPSVLEAGDTIIGFYCNLFFYCQHNKPVPGMDGNVDAFGIKDVIPEISMNEWHHIVINCDYTTTNNNIEIWLDGNMVVNVSYAMSNYSNLETNASLVLFEDPDGLDSEGFCTNFTTSQTYLGKLKNFRIFNRFLTEEEIQKLFQDTPTINIKKII